jgi:hypothetical protein
MTLMLCMIDPVPPLRYRLVGLCQPEQWQVFRAEAGESEGPAFVAPGATVILPRSTFILRLS